MKRRQVLFNRDAVHRLRWLGVPAVIVLAGLSFAQAAAGVGQDPVRGLLAALIGLLDRVGEEGEERGGGAEGEGGEATGDIGGGGGGGGCIEYFKLLTRLIKAPHALAEVNPTALAVTLAGRIVRRRVVEASEQEEDKVLQGLLTALELLDQAQHGRVQGEGETPLGELAIRIVQ